VLLLPLAPILESLPPDLAAKIASPASGTFSLPVRSAVAQLAAGAVKISFGQLRQGSPPGTFYDNATLDGTPVSLPLPQILVRLDPSLLTRRPGQKWVAVPESVTSVFGQGRRLQAPVCAPLQAAEPQAVPPQPAAPKPVPPDALDWLHAPVAAAPQIVRMRAPASFPKPPLPEPGTSHFARPPVTEPLPLPAPDAVLATAIDRRNRAATPPEAGPIAESEFVEAALSALSESWPAAVLEAIAEFKLQGATVCLPMSRLERGLKTGRVVFTWGELCQWLQPPSAEKPSAHGEVPLELPLKVVAPLFLARRRPWAAPKKLTGAADIPDSMPAVFDRAAGAPGTEAAAPAAASRVAEAPPSALGEIFGLSGRIEWTPAEICRRICALEGVTGSALAMCDGLVVAAQLPPGFNGETVAAFLPRIFGHASQSAGEMQLGPLTGVALASGRGRCAIYKAGKLYLAAMGDAGAALPEATLGRIAAEIGKRNP
jgi:predicted regulator of Ras-like GTPase activity (Roadblock/LC7/MglB family)